MLHRDDVTLLDLLDAPAKEGVAFGLADLVTLREELVRDDVIGTLSPLDGECVKLAPAEGRSDWQCRFLIRMPDTVPGHDAGCSIYDRRPSQCRALNCSDTRGIAGLYDHVRATRADVMKAVGAPEEWLGLFPAYEETCSYARIAPLAKLVMPPINPGTPAEKEATEALLETVRYDIAFRDQCVERGKHSGVLSAFPARFRNARDVRAFADPGQERDGPCSPEPGKQGGGPSSPTGWTG